VTLGDEERNNEIIGIRYKLNKINFGEFVVMDEITWNRTQKSRKNYHNTFKLMIISFICTSIIALGMLYLGNGNGLLKILTLLFFYIGYSIVVIHFTLIKPKIEFLQTLTYVEYVKNVTDERDLFRNNKKFTYPFYGSLFIFTIILFLLLFFYLTSEEGIFLLPLLFGLYAVYSGSIIYNHRNYYYKRNRIIMGSKNKNLVILESKSYLVLGVMNLIIACILYFIYNL
jgi:hypothetical protein